VAGASPRTTVRSPSESLARACHARTSRLTDGASLPFVTPFEHQDRTDEARDRRDRGADLEGFVRTLEAGHQFPSLLGLAIEVSEEILGKARQNYLYLCAELTRPYARSANSKSSNC
jgi:hypothetical protein